MDYLSPILTKLVTDADSSIFLPLLYCVFISIYIGVLNLNNNKINVWKILILFVSLLSLWILSTIVGRVGIVFGTAGVVAVTCFVGTKLFQLTLVKLDIITIFNSKYSNYLIGLCTILAFVIGVDFAPPIGGEMPYYKLSPEGNAHVLLIIVIWQLIMTGIITKIIRSQNKGAKDMLISTASQN